MIGEIWDYLMRCKFRLWLLVLGLALGGILGAKLMINHQTTVSQAREIGVGAAPTYNNSLTFRLLGKTGKVAYELVIARDFRSAQVTVTNEPLESAVSVNVLNPSGKIAYGEATTLRNNENIFRETSLTYSISLGDGYVIDVQGAKVQVISNLDRSIAKAFLPSGNSERYTVMTEGLRKSSWSEADGKTAMYNLLKTYIIKQIEGYKSKLSDAALNNKTLDVARKNEIVLAYYLLNAADQAPYREFINHLRQGGLPQITYTGKREYAVGEKINFADLVTAQDGEDGQYTKSEIVLNSDVDFSKAGQYTVTYSVRDSDANRTTLTVPITISGAKVETSQKPQTEAKPAVANNPAQSYDALPIMSSGANQDDDFGKSEQVEDDTAEEEIIVVEPTSNITITRPAKSEESKSAQDDSKPKGVNASQIVLIVLGIVLLIGLVRFIFDHYVR